MHTRKLQGSRLIQESPVPNPKHKWSATKVLTEPIKTCKLLYLRRALLKKVRGDLIVRYGEQVDPSVKRAAHEADIKAAFRARSLDLLNAYQEFSLDSDRLRIVTVAFLAYTKLPLTNRDEPFGDDHVTVANMVMRTILEYGGRRTSYGDPDCLISTTAAMLRYPNRRNDIVRMLHQRNFPKGDITPLVEELIHGGVLYEGAL